MPYISGFLVLVQEYKALLDMVWVTGYDSITAQLLSSLKISDSLNCEKAWQEPKGEQHSPLTNWYGSNIISA